jgi:hypothetical protein
MSRRPNPPRKRRTREHIIADLGVNHVERQVLLCGFTIERVVHDYGIDGLLFTYDQNGEVENDWIPLQIKSTDHPRYIQQGRSLAIRVERADLRSWLTSILPVILIVYDAGEDRAFWVYLQADYGPKLFSIGRGAGTTTIRIPTSQVLEPGAIRQIVGYRNQVIAQIEGKVEHHD